MPQIRASIKEPSSSNTTNLINAKYRRTKNLVKKTIEISNQCDLDFILLVYDKKFNRFREIYTNPELTLEQVDGMMKGRIVPNRAAGIASNIKTSTKIPKYKKEHAREIVQVEDRANNNEEAGQKLSNN